MWLLSSKEYLPMPENCLSNNLFSVFKNLPCSIGKKNLGILIKGNNMKKE